MKAIRELLELPEVMLDNETLGDIDYHESNYSAGQAQAYYDCSKQLQSALEAADLPGLVDRVERLEKVVNIVWCSPRKSSDKDNMEFEVSLTCYTIDKLRELIPQEQNDDG